MHSTQNGNDLIGANDTHSSDANPNSIGASVTHRGYPSAYLIGASDIQDGVDDTHRDGANGTLDWREWHSLNTLTLGLNHNKNTPTTTDGGIDSDSEALFGRPDKGVVGIEWNLSDLIVRNRVSAKNQELLLENGLTAQAFVAWLLYAASQGGNGIRDPIAHAVSRLIPDPTRGAGGAYDQLAGLSASELADLLTRELNGQSPWNQAWRRVMHGAQRIRLQSLAEQLGVSASNKEE
jgi:hypothetical protein